jgi:hypothetical protein
VRDEVWNCFIRGPQQVGQLSLTDRVRCWQECNERFQSAQFQQKPEKPLRTKFYFLLSRVPKDAYTVLGSPRVMSVNCDHLHQPAAVETWNTELCQELRQVTATQLGHLPPGQTVQTTDLVHEAWLKLGHNPQHWQSRDHFFGAGAQAMLPIVLCSSKNEALPL